MLRPIAPFLIIAAGWTLPALGQCPDGTPPPCQRARTSSAAAPASSIAVLYFDNLSRDTGDVYLADGFTEEVMNRLGQVEGLQIKSRAAVQSLRARGAADPLAAGRSLNVAHLVSGSVLRQRGRVRVNVELTRVSSGNRVWGGSFDRGAEDLISTEAEIAESVAVNVGARLAPAERQRVEARPTRNAAAYDHLLRGRFEQRRSTTAGNLAAIRQFQAALAIDPGLTSARVHMAASYGLLGTLYYSPEAGLSRDSLLALRERNLEQALREDSTSVDALMAQTAGQSPAAAISLIERALAAEPRNADVHHSYALYLRQVGRETEAIAEFRRAFEIDPDRAISLVNLGQTYVMMRDFASGSLWVDSALTLHPEASFYYKEAALTRLLLGDTAGARAIAPQIAGHGSVEGQQEIVAMLAARAGDSATARAIALRIDSTWARRDCFVSHECLEVAMTLGAAGLREKAVSMFERMAPRGSWLVYWSRRPELDVIRNEPRFQAVLTQSRIHPVER